MKQTPATAALGCGGSLIALGSFISGFYLGSSHAKGQVVDPALLKVLKYAPLTVGGLYSIAASAACLSVPENLEEVVNNAPSNADPAQVEGCAKGCLPIISGIGGAVFMAGLTYLGYAVGAAMGN